MQSAGVGDVHVREQGSRFGDVRERLVLFVHVVEVGEHRDLGHVDARRDGARLGNAREDVRFLCIQRLDGDRDAVLPALLSREP